mmetsp:Transcript_26404/g.73856  ORF Transcript_26404/g.73856 Transcript_26404/m.73856 type:complete len:249 (+) Transcript_26404:62-808(+)
MRRMCPRQQFHRVLGPAQGTVGFAIQSLYRFLQNSHLPTPLDAMMVEEEEVENSVLGLMDNHMEDAVETTTTKKKKEVDDEINELTMLPRFVELGIYCALSQGKIMKNSVGRAASASAFVDGNIVALYCPRLGHFIRLHDGNADYGGTDHSGNNIPVRYNSERFLVVGCKDGTVALYSPDEQSFLGAHQKSALAVTSASILSLDDAPRARECFIVNGGTTIWLTCKYLPRWKSEGFQPIQIQGIMNSE